MGMHPGILHSANKISRDNFMQKLIPKQLKYLLPRSFIVYKLVNSPSDCVLLTFDDGPHEQVTPKVLELLENYRARAIFFTVGRRVEKAPNIIKKIQNKGHLIGNHTYIHSNTKQPWFLAYWCDLIRCQALIEKYIGNKPKFFRPPCARLSLTSLTVAKILGMRTIMWSLDGGDWRCRTSKEAQKIAEYLIQNIKPRDIVLLHDDNPSVLIILDMLLSAIRLKNLDLHSAVDCISTGNI